MGDASRIEAVTFDVGGTLIEPWPSVGHVYAEVAERNGIPNLSPRELQSRFAAAFRKRARSIHLAAEWAEIVDETFAGLAAEPPRRTFFPELYERFSQAGAWRIYEDALPTLDALAERGLRLGVISNWDDRLRPLLDALGLVRRFQVIVISCEVLSSKPEPAIFDEAVRQLGVARNTLLHVGDSLEMDLEGARAAGLNAAQIKRANGPAGDGQIKSLLDVPAMI